MCPYSLDGELHSCAERTKWGDTLLLAFVQFSSSAEAGTRGFPASGLSKLSSVRSAGTSTWLERRFDQVRSTSRNALGDAQYGRSDRHVSLERR
jgi:hypothetical protein